MYQPEYMWGGALCLVVTLRLGLAKAPLSWSLNDWNSFRLLRTVEGREGSCRKLLRARLANVLLDCCKHSVHKNPVLLTYQLQGRLEKLVSLCAQEKGYELGVCQNMELSLLSLLCQ